MLRKRPGLLTIVFIALTSGIFPAYAKEPTTTKLTVYYEDRLPFTIPILGEGLIGFIASRVNSVLTDAGINYEWTLLPFQNQQEVLKRNQIPACAVGFFKNPSRESYMLFSKPIYHNRPLVVFANTKSDFSKYKTLKSLFADQSKFMLVKTGYTYGKGIDALMKQENPRLVFSDKRNVGMITRVVAGDADYMLGTPEELEMLVKLMDVKSSDYQFFQFPDFPDGETRHIACSKNVGQATMDKINAAIDKYSADWNKAY